MGGIWVIANPNAGSGRGGGVIAELQGVLAARGVTYTLRRTEAPGHAGQLVREARSAGAERLLIVGGDGTIHEAASGFFPEGGAGRGSVAEPAIAILPVGTGNDFHRMVRAPAGVESAADALLEGVPRSFEVGEARWLGGSGCFVNLIGVGIDVEVLRRRERFRTLPGLLQYLAAFGAALGTYEPVHVRVSLESGGRETLEIEAPVLLCAVTVGPSIGGGFLLSPNARPDDGLLDLFVVERLGVARVLRYLPGILRGSTAKRRGIWQAQGTRLRIEASDGKGLSFELDGELVEASTTFLEIEVRPGRLRILELPEESA
jgi:YegS/Rv2252/BmrU family lipid kinase